MKIFISTSDGHDLSLKPFYYLFNKFWGWEQEVTILGYRQPPFPLPTNFNFVSMADKQENVQQWSTDLRNYIKSIDDEHFIWAVEDAYILQSVDLEVLEKLESYLSDNKVGRIALTNDVVSNTEFHIISNCDGKYFIVELSQKSNCRISGIWSIWNREYFLKYMTENETPWEFEEHSSGHAKNDGYRILSSSVRQVVHCALGVRKKSGLNAELDFRFINDTNRVLDERIIKELVEEKLISDERTLI